MTPRQQQIAIAVVLGWSTEDAERGFKTHRMEVDGYIHNKISERIPDYVGDLNAVYEMENHIPWGQKTMYLEGVYEIADRESPELHHTPDCWDVRHARPEWCCEAFLKTLDLWTE